MPPAVKFGVGGTLWSLTLLWLGLGGRGAPAKHARKRMVDACCYVVRTGGAWRLLPKSFPPWRGVYKAFCRWAAAGTFEAMHDRLRAQWRARVGRNPRTLEEIPIEAAKIPKFRPGKTLKDELN